MECMSSVFSFESELAAINEDFRMRKRAQEDAFARDVEALCASHEQQRGLKKAQLQQAYEQEVAAATLAHDTALQSELRAAAAEAERQKSELQTKLRHELDAFTAQKVAENKAALAALTERMQEQLTAAKAAHADAPVNDREQEQQQRQEIEHMRRQLDDEYKAQLGAMRTAMDASLAEKRAEIEAQFKAEAKTVQAQSAAKMQAMRAELHASFEQQQSALRERLEKADSAIRAQQLADLEAAKDGARSRHIGALDELRDRADLGASELKAKRAESMRSSAEAEAPPADRGAATSTDEASLGWGSPLPSPSAAGGPQRRRVQQELLVKTAAEPAQRATQRATQHATQHATKHATQHRAMRQPCL
jgi:chorismate mutase